MLTQLTHDIATMSRRRWLAATAGLVLGLATFSNAKAADDTIKVGVLHSLSGTMAISETTLKDTVLFLECTRDSFGKAEILKGGQKVGSFHIKRQAPDHGSGAREGV